jgi:hypothetical protein
MTEASRAIDLSTDAERVLFIHVMKTGGTTLLWHLRNQFERDEVYPQAGVDFVHDPSKPTTFRHLTLGYLAAMPEERRRRIRVYAAHFPYLAREVLGGDLATLTILREPVDRTISLLRQWVRNRPQLGLTLEAAYELPQVYERLLHNHQTKVFSMAAADAPSAYVTEIDVDDARLALAKENLASVDVVGLTERYDDFLDLVQERFGWNVKRGVRANAAPDDTAGPGSDALRRRIAEDNAIDLEFYEYAKDLIAARRAGT